MDITLHYAAMNCAGLASVDDGTLARWIDEGPPPLILDVREPVEFDYAHLPASINVPLSRPYALLKRLPQDGLALLICEDGCLSREVARRLRICGYFRMAYLEGGVAQWSRAGRRVTGLQRRAALPAPAEHDLILSGT